MLMVLYRYFSVCLLIWMGMEYELTIFKLMNMFIFEYLYQNKYPTQQNNERNNASKYPVSHFHETIPFKKLNKINVYQSPKNNTP